LVVSVWFRQAQPTSPQGWQSFSLDGFRSEQMISVFGCGSWLAYFRDGFGFYVQCQLARVTKEGL